MAEKTWQLNATTYIEMFDSLLTCCNGGVHFERIVRSLDSREYCIGSAILDRVLIGRCAIIQMLRPWT
jgi:hypothetical protein